MSFIELSALFSFPRWYTVRGQSFSEKSCEFLFCKKKYYCETCTTEVVWLLAVKRRLRLEMCLSSYPWDHCGDAQVVHMSGARGCCVTTGLDSHILREEEKAERIRMESVTQAKAIYSGFSQYCASDIWYVLLKAWRWDFSLRICALTKTIVHLKMKTSWKRKPNPSSFFEQIREL